jgi:hypothetical protein
MMTDNDTILIQTLTDSYLRQLDLYSELRDVVRQLLSKLVLSRGDLSPVVGSFQRKKELVEAVDAERKAVGEHIVIWQERKKTVERTPESERFEAILQKVTDTIREFLNDEEQLRIYIEGVISRNRTPASQ